MSTAYADRARHGALPPDCHRAVNACLSTCRLHNDQTTSYAEGDIERVGTMSTKRKRPAKKGAPKRKKGTPKKKSAMSAVERRAPQGVLASVAMSAVERRSLHGVLASGEFRAHTHWPRKEDVPGYDPTAFNIPEHFEAVATLFRIWPWRRGADARPFQCLRAEVVNEPTYYRDAEGNTRVAARHNGYYLAQECHD
jgi:hypothetical protein